MLPSINLYSFSPDDAGNGEAFASLYADEFLFVHEYGWLYYTGSHWEQDKSELRARDKAADLLRARHKAAEKELHRNPTADKAHELLKNSKANSARIHNCLNCAQPHMYATVEEFNNSPDALNVQNGVLNLKTGTLKEHAFNQRFTYCCNADWNPQADMTAWLDFLSQVIEADCIDDDILEQIHECLQVFTGYSITGHTEEEKAVYQYGPRRSGKGTFQETLRSLFPYPLATTMEFATLAQKREPGSQNFDLAPLQPCRMVFASEGKRTDVLDAAKLKHLTGGDSITCSFKFKDHFSYRPQYKLWLASNWPINLDADDKAAWGRFLLIHFPISFFGHEDKKLKRKLRSKKNLEGVLRWCVEGSQKWYQHGLTIPEYLQKHLDTQQHERDYIAQWLDDCCITHEGSFTSHPTLYASYANWCKDNGIENPRGKGSFSQSLEAKGYARGKAYIDNVQKRGFYGLVLNQQGYILAIEAQAEKIVAEALESE